MLLGSHQEGGLLFSWALLGRKRVCLTHLTLHFFTSQWLCVPEGMKFSHVLFQLQSILIYNPELCLVLPSADVQHNSHNSRAW